MKNSRKKKIFGIIICLLVGLVIAFSKGGGPAADIPGTTAGSSRPDHSFNFTLPSLEGSENKTEVPEGNEVFENIPKYNGKDYEILNKNTPYFKKDEIKNTAYEYYSDLDSLGRCGPATACVCKETMPTEKRGEIGMIKPTGWHTVKYDCVDGKYLYNRCHLIGYQLTAENANRKNLITGTRYFNVVGMLPFENMVADYVKETNNHVMYRVTPVFENDDLVARGVIMEAWSVEDSGKGVCYNVFVFNIQPGVNIDYNTGESSLTNDD